MTELEVVINFDCACQNRFRSLETSSQGNKIIQTNNSFFQLVEAKKMAFHDNHINLILNKIKKL